MFKNLLLFITPIVLLSCETKSQVKVDKRKADMLFKESAPLLNIFLNLQIRNNDSARLVNRQLIEKYEQIYQADPTNEDIGHYLAYSYNYDKQYSKALKWYLEQLRHDTFETDIANHNEGAALCYINIGQFDSAKSYLQKAITINGLDKTSFTMQSTLFRYKKVTDDIYNQVDSVQIALLRSRKIKACQYSIELLNYMLPVAQKYLDKFLIPFNTDTIMLRQQHCR